MIARLAILARSVNGITFLKKCYSDPPFKVANITEDKKAHMLRLMLMSSSPGVLDADEYRININLEEDTCLQLHTQSYQRLFTMKQQAGQHTNVHLESGSSFCFIPHPVVPHKNSNFIARADFHLAENCSLIFGEVFTCGRKLNGEIFTFSRYHNLTRIYLNDKMVIKENLLMEPSLIDPRGIGQMQEFTHQASLVYLDEKADIKKIIPQLLLLLQHTDIKVGITAAPANGIIIRLLGQGAEQLFDYLKLVAGVLLQMKSEKPIAYVI
jgi:urease accessory protein